MSREKHTGLFSPENHPDFEAVKWGRYAPVREQTRVDLFVGGVNRGLRSAVKPERLIELSASFIRKFKTENLVAAAVVITLAGVIGNDQSRPEARMSSREQESLALSNAQNAHFLSFGRSDVLRYWSLPASDFTAGQSMIVGLRGGITSSYNHNIR